MTAKEFIEQRIQNEWGGKVYLGFYEDEEIDMFEMMELYAKSKSQDSDSLPCVSESKPFDIHNCINEVCDAVHARFHLYGQTAKGDGSFRWRVKQAIDKMLYSR